VALDGRRGDYQARRDFGVRKAVRDPLRNPAFSIAKRLGMRGRMNRLYIRYPESPQPKAVGDHEHRGKRHRPGGQHQVKP
jgi:hypothetical protein